MSSPTTKKRVFGPAVHAIKRAKYEAKQERQRKALLQQQGNPTHNKWASWFVGREEYAAFLTVEDVRDIRKLRLRAGGNGGKTPPAAADDERKEGTTAKTRRIAEIAKWIEPFFDLKEMPKTSSTEERRLFISEGTEAVRMMMQRCEPCTETNSPDATPSYDNESPLSPPPVRLLSILSKPATFFDSPTHLLLDVEKRNFINGSSSSSLSSVPPFKIIIASEEALSEIAGFPIARGAMACGVVPVQSNACSWLKQLLLPCTTSSECDSSMKFHTTIDTEHHGKKRIRRILALDAVSNTSNMGSILRTAAALSIDAIIVSDDSCDAWYRQSVRVSLGHVVNVPVLRVADWERGAAINDDNTCNDEVDGMARVLRWLRRHTNVECYAAVVEDDLSEGGNQSIYPPLVTLENDETCGKRSWCCVLGSESSGIRGEVIRECDKRIKIGMASGVDSLSLPVAAGILMHGLGSRSSSS